MQCRQKDEEGVQEEISLSQGSIDVDFADFDLRGSAGEAPAVRGFETCSACSRGDHGRIGAVGGLGHRDSVQSVLLVEALHLLVLVCWYIDDCVDGQRR